jgi:TonB-linked SusC/RagA family outer membrane protein
MQKSEAKLFKRIFYSLFFLTIFLPLSLKAQTQEQKRISLEVNNEPLSGVLKKISALSDSKIIFNTEDVEKYRVTVSIKNMTITKALDIILESKPFSYSLKGEFITLLKKEEREVATTLPAEHRTVTGKVVDDQQQPLAGVSIREKNSTKGTTTNADGTYTLRIPSGSTTLVYSYIGMTQVELIVKPGSEPQTLNRIEMKEDHSILGEVVVTGIFNKPRESYTGAATSFSRNQLETAGNRSLISTLRNLDPGFTIADNISMGSDPNRLPSITVRGMSSLPTDVKDAQVSAENQRTANQPLFILDGFEITLSHFADMDESQIENITILKDANATALYGSKGSNGVILITGKQIKSGKLRFSYKGTLNVEAPDLSSYNLMNSLEKLQYEKAAGLYESPNAAFLLELRDLYNRRKLDAERGVNTYWLKYPVRTGIGSRHNVSVEGGDQTMRYGANVSYNTIEGVMRGSERNVLNGDLSLLYRYKNLSFKENLQVMNSRSKNSPYGSFSQYCELNPYHTPYDTEGNILKVLEDYYYVSLNKTNKIYNPLYDAYLPNKNSGSYTSIINNFAVEWYILPELFARGQFSFTKTFDRSDHYVCADNTMFDDYTDENYSRKGRYTYGTGESFSYEGRFTLNYSQNFADKHQVFAGLGVTVDESTSESYSVVGEGITVNTMDFLGMAHQYLKDGRPYGGESISRDLGLLFNLRYTLDRRYFLDLNGKYDGSSQFGSNNHFAPFWSTGAGWNIHNEKFLSNNPIVNLARLRVSYGVTGSQNFASYLSMRTYQDYGGKNTQGWYGVYLMAYGNPDLQWQKTKQWNWGVDLEMLNRRMEVNVDVYNKVTDNLLTDVNLPLSSGFPNYKSNVGKIANQGVEMTLSAQIIRENDFRWTVGVKAANNSNKIKEISNSLQSLNDELSSQNSYNPSFLYKEGESLNTIYAVRSKGIDPSTGKEIYIKRDGTETFEWDAKDKVACGVAEPKIKGTIYTDVRWKRFKANLIFGYRLGGYEYNSTLADKVENINPYENADKRVLYDRWKEPGDISKFKSVKDLTATYATSRFIFKDNTFYGSSVNMGYEFPIDRLQKRFSLSYLALNAYLEDLFWLSTIRRERGIDYPFARKFSLSLTIRF